MQANAARRVGEQTEQLWAMLRPLSKKVRYMSPAHWQDCMDNALLLLSRLKQGDFAKLLKRKLDNNTRKLGA
jgi:hypothetical protein